MNNANNRGPLSEDPSSTIGATTNMRSPEKYEKTDSYLSRRMAIDAVQESAERLKADFLEQMEVKLSAVLNDVVYSMQKADTVDRYKNIASPSSTHLHNSTSAITSPSSLSSQNQHAFPQETSKRNSSTNPNRTRLSMSGKLPEKVFISRPSPLTELLQVTHFKTIHHIFIATLILIMIHNIILDLVEGNTLDLGLVRLMWAFGQPQLTLGILLGLEFCGLVVLYPAFHFWSKARHRVISEFRKVIDYIAALTFLFFLTGMIYVPAAIMWNNPLPPASGATVTMEQCRLLMKMYAFVRSNVPRVLKATTPTTGNNGCGISINTSSSKKSRKSSSSNSPTTTTPTTTCPPENSIWKQKRGNSRDFDDGEDAAGGVSQVSSSCSSSTSFGKSLHSTTEGNNGRNQEETLDMKEGSLLGDNNSRGTWAPQTNATSSTAATTTTDFPTSSGEDAQLRRRRKGLNDERKSFQGEEGEREGDDESSSTPITPKLMSLGGSCDINSENNNNVNGRNVGGIVGHTTSSSCPCPSYSKYLYFYVAPTLIYKDDYPRTSFVRWDYVCWNFAQVLGCIVYANFILFRYTTFFFINFGSPDHPMTVLQFCNAVFSMMLPGILFLVLGFYLLLHSWHNAFAEMLCFGDRLFYKEKTKSAEFNDKAFLQVSTITCKRTLGVALSGDLVRTSAVAEDWWNCSSFHSYYKTWNILVHDWLYTYIFKDAYEMGLSKYHKALPTILVFVISSLFHEYVLSFAFNFFFPVLLTLFGGFGLALTFVRNSESVGGNIFMWFGLISGSGILVCTYTMEFYARLNCPEGQMDAAADFFTPRFWTCNAIVWK